MSDVQFTPGRDLLDECLRAGASIADDTRLALFTTFRLGGPCPAVITCPTVESVCAVWRALGRAGAPRRLIGGGSNLLVSDAGLPEVVVRFAADNPEMEIDGSSVRVTASAGLDDFVRAACADGLDGVVYCSGIPGTVGGAIAGNAGAFGEQIGDRIQTVTVLDADGEIRELEHDDIGFAYRRSGFQESGGIILSAVLELEPADREDLERRRREILELRASKHPDWKTVPTAGSFFKNIEPTSRAGRRQAAGWFLEQAGALNMRAGGARTFERHANIVIGGPGCRAGDVVELTGMMADAVRDKFGLELEREVKLIGF